MGAGCARGGAPMLAGWAQTSAAGLHIDAQRPDAVRGIDRPAAPGETAARQ